MPDQLFLSYRLNGFSSATMVRQFEKVLRAFPFSKLSQASTILRVNAVSFHEPPLYERPFIPPLDIEAVLTDVREFQSTDAASTVEAAWDLWQHEAEWQVAPARVALVCLGPEFDSGGDDHLRIELGIDTHFLPQPELRDAAFMAQSNVRSLLHLVHDLDNKLPVERRRLWTESGENFAERLQSVLTGSKPGPRLVT